MAYGWSDVQVRFTLRDHIANQMLMDVADVPHYLAEFNQACERLKAMGAPYPDEDAIYQLLKGIPDLGSWDIFNQVMFARITESSKSKSPMSCDQVAESLE